MTATGIDTGSVLIFGGDAEYIEDYFKASVTGASAINKTHSETEVSRAYWWFVKFGASCSLIILDVTVSNRLDALDFAIALDSIAGRHETRPGLVFIGEDVYFGSAYHHDFKSLRFLGGIDKIDALRLRKDLESLASSYSNVGLASYRTSYVAGPAPPDERKYEFDKPSLKYSAICGVIGSERFGELIRTIANRIFPSYSHIGVTCLEPGYSGSDVIAVTCSRDEDSVSDKAFVLKMRMEEPDKIAVEAAKYFDCCGLITEYVPLLIGPIDIEFFEKRVSLFCCEFVGPSTDQIITYGKHLSNHAKRTVPWSRLESRVVSFATVDVLFGKILKKWHESDGASNTIVECYGRMKSVIDDYVKRLKDYDHTIYEAIERNYPTIKLVNYGIELECANFIKVAKRLIERRGDPHEDRRLDTAIIHGDFHCDNIVTYARRSEVYWKLIDFGSVRKQAHVAQDFARLECDIKFRWLPEELFVQDVRYQFELELAQDAGFQHHCMIKPKTKVDKSIQAQLDFAKTTIQHIRVQCMNRGEADDGAVRNKALDYQIALLFQSLFYFSKMKTPAGHNHALVAACFAAQIIETGQRS